MNSRIFMFMTCLSVFFSLKAQNDTAVLMTINNEKILKEDFLNTYRKNNDVKHITKADLDEYIKLYTQFKLKVQEAQALKYDTTLSFQNEYHSYTMQSAQHYLTDKEVTEELINEAYERAKWHLRASHILIKCDPNSSPKDTLAAYQKIMNIRDKIISGMNFNDAAYQFSEDPSAKDYKNSMSNQTIAGNKGDLGYFTVFELIYPFESAVYNLNIGEVSMPVKSDFGYHLIYLMDKVPAVAKVKASHIYIKQEPNSDAKAKIEAAYQELLSGKDFKDVVKTYSEDKATIEKNGEMTPFGLSRRPGNFIKTILNLKPGEISKPILIQNGWHIIKLDEIVYLNMNEDRKGWIKSKIAKDSRSEKSKDAFINKLKMSYNYEENGKKKALKIILKNLDSTLFKGNWDGIVNLKKDFPICTFADQSIYVKDFVDYLKQHQARGLQDSYAHILDIRFQNFIDEILIQYENHILPVKYPEFKDLIKEYYEGMLLYEINTDKVWGKAVKDTSGLKAFYETVKNNYIKDAQIKLTVFNVTPKTYATVVKLLNNRESYEFIDSVISKKFKTDIHYKEYDISEKDSSNFHYLFSQRPQNNQIISPEKNNGTLIYIENYTPKTPKKLSEIKAIIITEYQNYLEKQWIDELYKKATIKVNQEVYNAIFK